MYNYVYTYLYIYMYIQVFCLKIADSQGFPLHQIVTVTLRCPAVEGQRLHKGREAQQHANARIDVVPSISIQMADPLGS